MGILAVVSLGLSCLVPGFIGRIGWAREPLSKARSGGAEPRLPGRFQGGREGPPVGRIPPGLLERGPRIICAAFDRCLATSLFRISMIPSPGPRFLPRGVGSDFQCGAFLPNQKRRSRPILPILCPFFPDPAREACRAGMIGNMGRKRGDGSLLFGFICSVGGPVLVGCWFLETIPRPEFDGATGCPSIAVAGPGRGTRRRGHQDHADESLQCRR
jgi:hypothetical protein